MHDDIAEALLHLYDRFAQARIDQHQVALFEHANELLLERNEHGSPELMNALDVSFLGNIPFEENETGRR